jgi:uncharacterized protein (TIGR00255 family)
MIRSMTGYGKATAEIPGRKLSLEIKSLNSKQNDINIKLPAFLRGKEMEMRTMLAQSLERGKIDVYISAELSTETPHVTINKPLALRYHAELKDLLNELHEESPEGLLQIVMRMPEVLQAEKEELAEAEWGIVHAAFEESLAQVDAFRMKEGKVLETDMGGRIALILDYLKEIEPLEPVRLDTIKTSLRKNFEKYSQGDNTLKVDPNRFEQELIFYLEKIDFTEEKVRLRKHCAHFTETMSEEGNQGKKLGFITQEIGREVNTLGSKANDAAIQRLVVQMKDELEKVKEQLGNIL